MIDMHNDLLTLAYTCYLKNDYSPLLNFNEMIHNGNVKGIVANLYFMSEEEMKDELDENYYNENISIIDMFKRSKSILNEYIKDVDFVYSIEGCDYLKIEDLKYLKEEGLNSILLVWNNPNIYGSGIRDNYGLTLEGKLFIEEAIKLNIGIDISHANKNTCMDILSIVKQNNYKLVYGSHSNIKTLFKHDRNLDDEELNMLKSVGGKLGLVAINIFAKDIDDYIEHIKYASDILGMDNVLVASDNIDYVCVNLKDSKLWNYDKIYINLKDKLKKYFNDEQINKILYLNGKELFNMLRER